jgi:hypothetical protein
MPVKKHPAQGPAANERRRPAAPTPPSSPAGLTEPGFAPVGSTVLC